MTIQWIAATVMEHTLLVSFTFSKATLFSFSLGVIAGGTNNPYNVSGAAPQATLSA